MNTELKLQNIENLLGLLVELIQNQAKKEGYHIILTQKELLTLLEISPNTLKSWENKGLRRLEPPIENTRTVFYKLDEVIQFLTP
ncbi:MerR family transcriptional regulator [Streptococcus panodentis]|uniref:HTH merR-type domain-containing protein n=1 Tax=Streptococcus panodentis TaxID=1581472 RepID=A0ABS5AUR9_9STRE|nr:MerR family transcriptional regulator [Streptococcus panodentis]MBP2620326.1 hypothetical protein [Streptococcus panodentis]